MFQDTCLFVNCFISYLGYVYALFLKINCFSPKLNASVSCHSYAKIWFQKQYHNY